MEGSVINLFDSHAHLDDPAFEPDLDEVLNRAQAAGVVGMLAVGSSLESSTRTVELAQKYDSVYAAVGVHPHEVEGIADDTIDEVASLAKEEKVVAIGEIGLDFYRNYAPREVQLLRFRQQVELAKELGLPLIVHDRQAHQDILAILKEVMPPAGGVLHCFSGDASLAKQAGHLGFYISFAGNITYANAPRLRETARSLSIDRMLIETDCPYLTPEPNRGKRNEPAYVSYVAQALAELHGLTQEDAARITTRNAARLFDLTHLLEPARIAYKIRESLYLNITNRCTLECTFCAKRRSYTVKGHFLKLPAEPTVEEILQAVGDPSQYKEVVFCGFGEPLLRLDTLLEVAQELKKKGTRVRIDTDGLANLVHGRNILPELAGLVDSISISLNADSPAKYAHICPSAYGEAAYQAVKEFILEAKRYIPEVTATIVTLPGIDIAACRKIAEEELGVKFRARVYNEVG